MQVSTAASLHASPTTLQQPPCARLNSGFSGGGPGVGNGRLASAHRCVGLELAELCKPLPSLPVLPCSWSRNARQAFDTMSLQPALDFLHAPTPLSSLIRALWRTKHQLSHHCCRPPPVTSPLSPACASSKHQQHTKKREEAASMSPPSISSLHSTADECLTARISLHADANNMVFPLGLCASRETVDQTLRSNLHKEPIPSEGTIS